MITGSDIVEFGLYMFRRKSVPFETVSRLDSGSDYNMYFLHELKFWKATIVIVRREYMMRRLKL